MLNAVCIKRPHVVKIFHVILNDHVMMIMWWRKRLMWNTWWTFLVDEEGSCPRSLCECDKKMASGLASLESEWEEGYHSKWSKNLEVAFDRESTCRTNLNGFNWARSMHGGGGGGGGNGGQPDACCGEEGEK